MGDARIFHWHDDIGTVYGIHRAAVYDFRTGAVFSLNSQAARIIRLVDANTPIGEMDARQIAFVKYLVELRLGLLVDKPVHRSQESSVNGLHPLTFMWLELTSGCNLGCMHCYAESQNPVLFPQASSSPTGPPLVLDDWKNLLQQGAELNCGRVQFIGGEVLLHPQLIELIDAALDYGYTFIEVYSNGTLLTERKIKAFADRDVHLAVSLHGTRADTHDKITGLPGSFARTVSGLRKLREYDVPVRLAGVALQNNQHDIIHLEEIAHELDITEVNFDVVRGVGTGSNPDLMPDDPQVLARKWLSWPNFIADREEYEHNQHWNPCWAGKLAITSTGNVMPCVMGRSEIVGNICKETLAGVLKSPRLLTLWGLTKDHVDVCRDCEYRYVCGDCRPLAISAGDLHGAIPRCTHDLQVGDWGLPGTDARRQGPAPEGTEPMIAYVGRHSGEEITHFRCEPDNSPPQEDNGGE